jgi:hypothetical protein
MYYLKKRTEFMEIVIAYVTAGFSMLALIALWFLKAYKVLQIKREAVYTAQAELQMHQNGYITKLGSPEESTARHMLEISSQIHEQIKDAYNKTYRNPAYRFPGILMGFKNIN